MKPPEIRYAPVGDAYVAYQVFGEGPVDLVFQAGWYTHLGQQWDEPEVARFLERLASFARVTVFDRRGHGMSDPVEFDALTLEHWMEDLTAVMDDALLERVVLLGGTEAGPMQMLYGATHPERITALVLINTTASFVRTPDYPWGLPEGLRRVGPELIRDFILGRSDMIPHVADPSSAHNEVRRESLLRMARFAMSPSRAAKLLEISLELDVRDVLPMVRVPTLILHRVDQPFALVGHGRYLASHILDAKYVELPGDALLPWMGDQDGVLDEIEEFVTGVRPVREPDRVLSTVLFTDIVGSTEHAAQLGDRKWGEVLERIDVLVRRELDSSRGRFVKDTGDGCLATFDGPARAVRCAMSVVDAAKRMDVELRVGLHTGEIELAGEEVRGIAVHIGARVAALASAGEVLVSRTVTDLVAGSGLSFAARGSHALKGVPGEWQLYAVER